jgi:hypothetical protein
MTIRSLRAFKQKSDYIKIFKYAPIPLQVLLPLPSKNGLNTAFKPFFRINKQAERGLKYHF